MTFVHVKYTTDGAVDYQIKMDAVIQTWQGISAEALNAHPKLPSNIKPRYRHFTQPSGKNLKVIIPDVSKAVWTDLIGTSISGYPTPGDRGTPEAVVAGGTIGEKVYSR